MRRVGCLIYLSLSSLTVLGQATYDLDTTTPRHKDSVLTISKQVDEVEVVQKRSAQFVTAQGRQLVVDMVQIDMPRFLGNNDPMRYIQSLAGIQTNNETTTGIHIQGCDDYQSLISINGAPIYYPNHLLGIASTFISDHYSRMTIEQAEHTAAMDNRIGGWVDLQTHHRQPPRFGFSGNVGLINSDLTFTIPCGKKSSLWLSARTSYINAIYGKLLNMDGIGVGYHFVDANLTYSIHPTDQDEVVISGFYSRDKIKLNIEDDHSDIGVCWQNVMGSCYWNRTFTGGSWRSTLSFSGFNNDIDISMMDAFVNTQATLASANFKNKLALRIQEHWLLNASLDYAHYINYPLEFKTEGLPIVAPKAKDWIHADELSLGADMRHDVCDWFSYNIGLHAHTYHHTKWFGGVDPRVSFHFFPAEHHEISLHYGMYAQYFHKAGLTGGGLPTDFFIMADSTFLPERSHALNLHYTGTFLDDKLTFQVNAYFKQIYHVVESYSNIFQLVNSGLNYEDYLLLGDGRNYGVNMMLQKNKGVLTGYLSYSLGWAKRKFPQLDGSDDYIYSASHERRHELDLVLNARFAKRWSVGGQFVLATGLPYTEAKEAYMLNGTMICLFSTFNGAHMPLYNRLDLSCSCDIIKTKEHELGINLSIYNVYCAKNAQFVVYRDNLRPIMGKAISTIIPSISIYGKF